MVRLSPRSFRVVGDHEQRPTLSSAPLAADHVGMVLREARESVGHALSDIAYTLRIRYLFLQAIEEGRFADLPGTTYAVGFVRSYADFLGLDSAAVVARFKAETADARGETSLAFPETAPERRFFPSAAVIMVSLLAIGGAIGGWFYLQDEQAVVAQRIAEPPALPAFDRDLARAQTKAVAAAVPPDTTPDFNPPPAPGDVTVAQTASEIEIATSAGPPAPSAGPPAPSAGPPAPSAGPSAPSGDIDVRPQALDGAPALENGAVDSDIPDAAEPLATKLAQILPAPAPQAAPAAPAPQAAPAALATKPAVALPVVPTRPSPVQPSPAPVATVPASLPAIPKPPNTSGFSAAVAAEVAPESSAPKQLASRGGQGGELALPAVPAGALPAFEGRVYGGANRDARIVILATADSWVQVRDGAQNVLLTRMLRAGDSYRVPDRQDLWLLTGNAGGLEIRVDGEPIATLGPSGEVLRDVPLDVTALKAR